MDKETYQRLLQHPNWQKKRVEILKRDDFTCQDCGKTNIELHVHHLKYNDKEPWTVPNEWLVTLCDTCHTAEHAFRCTFESELLNALKENTFITKNVFTIIRAISEKQIVPQCPYIRNHGR
jgi:hypothetical protein